jgi:radical SAM/Cys-rich protein
VDAGPDRREVMASHTVDEVIEFLQRSRVDTLDVTGGAPEMNPHFRRLIMAARELGKRVIDRSNLTILVANGFQDLPDFLARQDVHIIASLPCYLEENCDAQRGRGVFRQSIAAITHLNTLGYGQPGSTLQLDLVYNPQGMALPPEQSALERAYKDQLYARYGVVFNRLLTITNMPVSRFLDELVVNKRFESYMQKLIEHFNPATLASVMCRTLVSVDWQGYLFDCDFNQMLDIPLRDTHGRLHIGRATDALINELAIKTGNHCFGCTAGCGSSCSGALMA